MSDWPRLLNSPSPGVVTSLTSATCWVSDVWTSQPSANAWPAANRALYYPFAVEAPVTAYQMAFQVTTQSGNCDVGLYTEQGVRLVSAGSTAVGAAGFQSIDITDTALLPGNYYMAMCVDNTTAAFTSLTTAALWLQVVGVQQQAVGAVTLPDPATFANPASAYVHILGVALKSTI